MGLYRRNYSALTPCLLLKSLYIFFEFMFLICCAYVRGTSETQAHLLENGEKINVYGLFIDSIF